MAKKSKKLKVDGARLQNAVPEPDHDYETQNHMRTLIDAHEIMNSPEKMKKVHKLAGRHSKAIRGIKDISDYKNAKYGAQVKGDKADMDNGDGDLD